MRMKVFSLVKIPNEKLSCMQIVEIIKNAIKEKFMNKKYYTKNCCNIKIKVI